MKKLSLIPVLMLCGFMQVNAQNFGSFASGVFLTKNGSLTGYTVTGDAANQISTNQFSGDLGTFQKNSGNLVLNGGETKTYKQNWANVCGSVLYYSVHPAGSTSSYSNISLPYKAGCNGSIFSDGLGNCSGNDQKWSTSGSSVDLTSLCPGTYTVDVYFSVPGSNNNTYDCGENQYVGSAASPAASATFTIAGTAPTITVGATNCSTGTATLTASNYTGNVTWSNGQTGASITAPVGSYTATSSSDGCTSPASAVATVQPCPVACPASGNLLVNGSFEQGVIPSGSTWGGITQPGWAEVAPGNNGLIETWTYSAYAQVSDGNKFIELNYLTLGTIEQNVSVTPNQVMTLSYDHKSRFVYTTPESVRIDIIDVPSNQVIQTLTSSVTDNDWHHFATTFTPTSSNIKVRFVSLNASRDGSDQSYGNFLDNVALNYNSCFCNTPITILGDTSVCPNDYSTLTVEGAKGANISWTLTDTSGEYHIDGSSMTGINGYSYVASCVIPGCSDTTFSAKVTVDADGPCSETQQRGINSTSASAGPAKILIAPNPITDAAALKLSGFDNGEVSVQITNLNGSVISNTKNVNVNGFETHLDLSVLPAGMYFVKAQQGGKVAVAKVVKK